MNNQNLEQLNKRDFDECYFCLYCVSLDVFMSLEHGKVEKQNIYVFYGCNLLGKRMYLTSVVASNITTTSSWYDFFQTFKTRGVKEIFYATLPNNKYLKEALKLAFLNIETFLSIYDTIDKVSKYFSNKYDSDLLTYIKNIYLANDLNGYNLSIDEFKSNYNYPFILELINDNLNKAKDIYYLPFNIRKCIFAYYFLRENLKDLIVISHKKPSFSSLDEFLELCLPVFQAIEVRIPCSKAEWLDILNVLYSLKKDLIKEYL